MIAPSVPEKLDLATNNPFPSRSEPPGTGLRLDLSRRDKMTLRVTKMPSSKALFIRGGLRFRVRGQKELLYFLLLTR